MARYTFEFNDNIDKNLSDLAAKKQTTKADILRRALISYAYLDRESDNETKMVSITDQDGKVIKDVVLP